MNEREIFIAARQKENAADRAAFLDEACAGDAELRQRVGTLLKEHDRLGNFLESPGPVATVALPLGEHPGTVIGPYKLLQQIGEGGMGTVFMAEQTQPVKRKVALKVIKLGPDHPDTLTTMNNLASCYRDAGKLELALPLFQQAAAGIEKLRFMHQDAVSIIGNLITCHEQLKQFDQAAEWRKKLDASKR